MSIESVGRSCAGAKARFIGVVGLAGVALLVAGCGDDGTGPGGLATFAGDTTLALSKAAGLTIAIGVAPVGFGFFDNFFACPGRGIVDFAEEGVARDARAHGCDLGDGVVIDGPFEVRTRPGGALVIGANAVGEATLRTDRGTIALPILAVDGLSLDPFAGRSAVADPDTATLLAYGRRVALDPRGSPATMFSALSDARIPNPAGDLSAFTDDDVRRVVFDPAIALAAFLLDELLEIQRGPHTHDIGCGTLDVQPDTITGLTGVVASLDGCDFPLNTGIGGDFEARWTAVTDSSLTMEIDGALALEGGLPTVILDRVEWTVEVGASFEQALFRGEITAGATTRPFSYLVPVSD